MFIFKIRSIVRAGHGGTCLYSQHWERRFPGKEDQQFKASLRYTIGLSPAWDTWGQPRIYLYKEHVWEWSLMDLEHEEKNLSFDHMLTSARDSRFKYWLSLFYSLGWPIDWKPESISEPDIKKENPKELRLWAPVGNCVVLTDLSQR